MVFDFLQPDKCILKKAKTSSNETSSETQDEGGDTDIPNSSGSSSEVNSVDTGSDNDGGNESTETEQGMWGEKLVHIRQLHYRSQCTDI